MVLAAGVVADFRRVALCGQRAMNENEGLESVDTNAPYDAMDALLTRGMLVCVGIATGMFLTAALIFAGGYFGG